CDAAHGHESAGGHFNPDGGEHGFLAADGPHAGDLPNQYVGDDGVLRAQIHSALVRLDDAERGIRGRALVLHAGSDDYRTGPAGASPAPRAGRTAIASLSRADLQARRGPFFEDAAAEAEKRGGTAAGGAGRRPRRLDEFRSLDEAAEILLVQMAAGNRLHGR